MKKLLIVTLAVSTMLFTSVTSFAAEPAAPYVCPNGNAACVSNGACLNDGDCLNYSVSHHSGRHNTNRGNGHHGHHGNSHCR